MKNILSFEDEKITYLRGKSGKRIEVKGSTSIDLEKGIIVGGVINDEEAIMNTLLEFKRNTLKKNKMNIVINSSIFYREIVIPLTRKSMMREIIKNEIIAIMSDYDDYIMDYAVLNTDKVKKTCNILVFVIYKNVLKRYIDVAAKSGISIESIDIASNAASKLFGFINPNENENTFAVMMIYKDSIDLYIIENSCGVLFRNIKLSFSKFKENNALDIAYEEVTEHINQIVQFQKGRNKVNELKTIYVYADFDEFDQLLETISSGTGLSCLAFEDPKLIKVREGFSIFDNIAPLGALIKRK
ncbi:MAG: hypothetical protein PHT02_08930 [Tissierellia bacterium]|nr:hypothetical protein [Tissierellia bacterium]